ncbi:WXG100 family type VII secretion target [Anaerosporobacter faecicola]|uniref:WXG100 family type VII secretion target n=1 Tax=Anaerosporobacter faecicola TaxID=2718714 RepID=UPI00143B2D65|nr:WXG100 family type VII secretion target [Anaerosporobacter faecicola]
MSEASIAMDFAKACKQSEQIHEIANQLSTLSTKQFDETMRLLSSNWEGDSSKQYLNKCVDLQEAMKMSADNIHDVATTIYNVAKRIYEAELRNLQIAQQRNNTEK